MSDIYNNLRKAIDEQNIEAVRVFINKNPDLDYSNISTNGASALWWALMPPVGKTISDALVMLLLGWRKPDGNLLVSPVQSFAGLTPFQYISLFGERFADLRIQLLGAEGRYVAPQNGQGNLAAIAMGKQSAHDSSVVSLARSNIIALYRHYVREKGLPLDKDSLYKAYAQIKDFIEQVYQKGSPIYLQTLNGLDYCFKNNSLFEFSFEEENTKVEFNLTLAALITLNWLAAHEQEADLLPQGADDTAGLSRKTALLIILYDIATAYGMNRPSCAGGACSRLGMTLAAQHVLVKSYEQDEFIQGEMARIIILRILGETLQSLSQKEPERYAKILCYLSMTEPEGQIEVAKAAYKTFIEENQGSLREKLEHECIAPETINANISALQEDNYPVMNHFLSYQLTKVLPFLEETERAAFFNGEITFEEIIAQAKARICEKLHTSKIFNALLTAYACNASSTLAQFFVSTWLERARFEENNRNINHVIKGFTKEEDEIFAKETFWIALFLFHKPHLKETFPKQARWLDSLTDSEIITLFSAIGDATIGSLNHNANAFMSTFVAKALEIGITANLVLENMTFENMDFRGHNFSGLHFKDVTFKNCLLPFAGDNIQCENLVFEQCTLPALSNIGDVDTLSDKLLNLSDKPYPPSNLVINFFLSLDCAPALLERSRRWGGLTALHLAAKNGHTDVAQAILNSPHLTSALLEKTTGDGRTAFHIAAANGYTGVVQAILDSPHCTSALVGNWLWNGGTALEIAASYGNKEVVRIILDSNYYKPELLKRMASVKTALWIAARYGHTGFVQAILDSSYCTTALLEETSDAKETLLHIAAANGHAGVVQAILNSRHSTPELLKKKSRDGQTASQIASQHGHQDVAQAILNSPHCTSALLEKTTGDRQTAFRIASQHGHQDVVQAIPNSLDSLSSSRFFSKPTIIGTGIGGIVLGGLVAAGIATFILLAMPPVNIGLILIFTALMLGSLMLGSAIGATAAKSFERRLR